MDQCTENYECLVIHNNAKSNKLTDQVFWYKAEPRDNVRLGSQKFWEYDAEKGAQTQTGGGANHEDYTNSKYVINKKY